MKNSINMKMVSSLVFSTTLLICLTITDSFGQKATDWNKNELRGKVKSDSICAYDASEKFGEVVKGEKQANSELILKFDISGNILEKEFYENSNNYGSNEKLKTIYSYSSNGYISESNTYNNDNLIHRTIFKCNIKGNVIEEAIYDHVGDLEEKTTNKYDQSGNIIESKTNNKGTETMHKYKYDLKGNIIEEEAYFGESKIGTVKTKYDIKGNIIETSAKTYEGVNVIETYKYTFDEKGNYISKTIYRGSSYSDRNINNVVEAKQIIERVIEYY